MRSIALLAYNVHPEPSKVRKSVVCHLVTIARKTDEVLKMQGCG